MNLTSLEQSKKLKEWGAPQDTAYVWVEASYSGLWFVHEKVKGHDDLSAYDLESLIVWLPRSTGELYFHSGISGDNWYAGYSNSQNSTSDLFGIGQTPLEAVYSLARALHQPNN